MKTLIHTYRSKYTRDSLERNRGDRIFFRQWFEVDMIITNMSDYPGFPQMPVLRSKCQIPSPLRSNNIVFDYIGSLDRLSSFQVFTEPQELLAALNGRYTGDKKKALWMQNYLYVFNTLTLPAVLGSTVFDDPLLVTQTDLACTCNTGLCYDEDSEYPAPRDVQQRIVLGILADFLRVPTLPEDKLVNEDEPQKTEESHRN
jgi:hypothetical protein